MKKITTSQAPAAIGPYSQGIKQGSLVFTSGQIPFTPKGVLAGNTIEEQALQAIQNVGAVLEAAGCSYDDVVKTTCFLADMDDFAKFNVIYAQYFTSAPARSCVAVKTLPKNVLVEIEAIAIAR